MTIKSTLSVVALLSGIAFSGAAFAQEMTIAGAPVAEADVAAVQERCDQLSTAASTQSLVENSENEASDSSETGASVEGDATISSAEAVNEIQQSTTTIDLETITLQNCIDGGFVAN